MSDGKSFSEREQDATDQRVRLLDSKALSYRQVNTDRDGLYRIVKTYTTDPARNTVMVRVRFDSLTKRKLDVYVLPATSARSSAAPRAPLLTDPPTGSR